VGFGLVLGADGKKFKTRSGDTEKLIDLLTEAVDQARALVIERLPTASTAEIDHLAKVLGIGAVKYADLSSHRTKDYTFSYERMLRFEGNTAVFLLYAYVRINGIKRKIQADIHAVLATSRIALAHPTELSLAIHLRRFGEILESVARDLLPNRLADYLYELAEKFNAFFRDCRVEGSPEENSRLLLCELTARVLKQGLSILGLETVDRM
jgi:arginyl-tRNA synthetase